MAQTNVERAREALAKAEAFEALEKELRAVMPAAIPAGYTIGEHVAYADASCSFDAQTIAEAQTIAGKVGALALYECKSGTLGFQTARTKGEKYADAKEARPTLIQIARSFMRTHETLCSVEFYAMVGERLVRFSASVKEHPYRIAFENKYDKRGEPVVVRDELHGELPAGFRAVQWWTPATHPRNRTLFAYAEQ